MFKRFFGFFIAFILVGLIGGCASSTANPDDPTTSLVYFYIDHSDAPTDIRSFTLKGHKSATGEPWYYSSTVDDGVMSHIAVEPGTYSFDSMGGIQTGFLGSQSQWIYEFGDDVTDLPPVSIPKPGVYFGGSYKLVVKNRGLFRDPQFDLLPQNSPSEKEVLQKLIVQIEKNPERRKFTRQLSLARERLAALTSPQAN